MLQTNKGKGRVSNMNSELKRYLSTTFLITWVCWWVEALLIKLTAMGAKDLLPMILFTVGGMGPPIAAYRVMSKRPSWSGVKKAIFSYKKSGVLIFVLFALAEIALFTLSSDGFIDDIKQAPISPAIIIGVVFLQAVFIYGGNEEWGWRGTMQPLVAQRMPFVPAVIIVGVVWSLWHLPLWFIEGDGHQGMNPLFFLAFGIILSFWLAAIYKTSRSVFFTMLFHGLTNTLMGVLKFNINFIFLTGCTILTIGAILIYSWTDKRTGKTEEEPHIV
jgi:membrane protease YdiL (CAAX protease family)